MAATIHATVAYLLPFSRSAAEDVFCDVGEAVFWPVAVADAVADAAAVADAVVLPDVDDFRVDLIAKPSRQWPVC